MTNNGNLAREETRPLDRETLLVVQDRLGALATDMAFNETSPSEDTSNLDKAKLVGKNQGVGETIDKLHLLLLDLLEAESKQ